MRILITGTVCSGKTSLANTFISKGYKYLKQQTNRPLRSDDDLLCYNILSNSEIDALSKYNKILLDNTFFNYRYVILKEDFEQDNWVCAIGSKYVKQLHDLNMLNNVYLIKLNVSENEMWDRFFNRSESGYNIIDRYKQDLEDLKSLNDIKFDLELNTWKI